MDLSRRSLAESGRHFHYFRRKSLFLHGTTFLILRTSLRYPTTDARSSKADQLGTSSQTEPVSSAEDDTSKPHPASSATSAPPPQSTNSPLPLTEHRPRIWTASNSLQLQRRLNALITQASSGLESIGGKLNQLTGYDEIEDLKRQVKQKEEDIARLRTVARAAKRAFEDAVSERSSCQREVNDLLQRKSSWTEYDVSRFTALVRTDHLNEQAEQKAKLEAAKAEEDVERGQTELMQTILHRYHEEQVWSDKIRSASTYGSLLALGLNLFVFILAIVAVEPWKRRRLAQTFEKRVQEMERDNQELVEGGLERLQNSLDAYEATIARIATAVMPPGSAPLPAMEPIIVGAGSEVDEIVEAFEDAMDEDTLVQPLDWRTALMSAWGRTRTRPFQDNDLVVAGLGGAVVGALATGVVTFVVWSLRK